MSEPREESMYLLRSDFAEDITSLSFFKFLLKRKLPHIGNKPDYVITINESVNDGLLSKVDLYNFLDNETRYGHNRQLYYKDIDSDSLKELNALKEKDIIQLINSKGWDIPKKNDIVEVYLPDSLILCEFSFHEQKSIELTFVNTIQTETKDSTRRENNFYFTKIDLQKGCFSVRFRPRGNVIEKKAADKRYNRNSFYYVIEAAIVKIFSIGLINSFHFKSTLYKIAKELTEQTEQKWRLKVAEHKDIISKFSDDMLTKLPDISLKQFDLGFRLHRLLERALIQSNFSDLRKKEDGKKGWVSTFIFSDDSGGRIKASSKEEDRAIQLAEIYYDTRETIDKKEKMDKLWVHWFLENKKDAIKTRLEATEEYYEVHFFYYIEHEDDLNYVLRQIDSFKSPSRN